MVTGIKMKVTPELSKRVQEIVFKNGGVWLDSNKKINYLSNQYLCITIGKILLSTSMEHKFDNYEFEEVSPYDFIASNGEQKWLPRFDEIALFSDDKKEWSKGKFRCYEPNDSFGFRIRNAWYKYCKPLPKKLIFKDFLEENNIDWEKFLENCKTENQRWDCKIYYYDSVDDLKDYKPKDWVSKAFKYKYNLLGIKSNNIYDIAIKWREKVLEANENNIGIIWDKEQ